MLTDPEFGFRLIFWMSWALILLGLAKMVIWIIGEVWPNAYRSSSSPGVRKFMTGKGNRLLFGLGGLLTALIGAIFLALGTFLESLAARF